MDITPIFNGAGQCTHFVAIGRDITEEKKNEAQLHYKTTVLEAQLESSIDGILVVDNQQNLVLQITGSVSCGKFRRWSMRER